MKKKMLSIFIITCMLTSSLACTLSSAVETSTTTTTSYTDETTGDTIYVTSDGFEYIITENSEVCITKYTGDKINLIIPEQIEGLPVTKLKGTYVKGILEKDCTETVTLPHTIKTLWSSFKGSTSLKKVLLNEGLEEIACGSFKYCSNLIEITIPSTVKVLPQYQFSDSLKDITILSFDIKNFYDISDTTVIHCYENTELYTNCQKYCKSLGIYTPSEFSFTYELDKYNTAVITGSNFKNITEIDIPKQINGYIVTGIGDYAFSNYEYLKKVTMPDTIENVGLQAFYNCDSLESINLSKNIRELPTKISTYTADNLAAPIYSYYGVFQSCNKLKSINVPNGIEVIEYNTFLCRGLKTIILPKSIKEIQDDGGYNTDINIGISVHNNLTIYTYPQTTAVVKFAEKYDIPYKIIGDISNDNNISSHDALSLLQHTIGLSSLDEEQAEMCDFNLDSKITSEDALKILQYTVSLCDSLYS